MNTSRIDALHTCFRDDGGTPNRKCQACAAEPSHDDRLDAIEVQIHDHLRSAQELLAQYRAALAPHRLTESPIRQYTHPVVHFTATGDQPAP